MPQIVRGRQVISYPFAIRLLSAAAVAVALAAAPAAAKSDREVMNELGLYGQWAPDCSSPPAANNPYVIRSDIDGRTTSTLVFDRGITFVSSMRDVRTVGADRIRWIQTNPQGLSFEVTVQYAGQRTRSLQSIGSDGTTYVKDGIMKEGGETRWLTRCSTSTEVPKTGK